MLIDNKVEKRPRTVRDDLKKYLTKFYANPVMREYCNQKDEGVKIKLRKNSFYN